MKATSHSSPHDDRVQHLLRELAPQVLGVVARRHGDFVAAEDAVQEALIAASVQWPRAWIPANPRGWLFQVAMRRMTDHIRSETARRRREDQMAAQWSSDSPFSPPADSELGIEQDDTLILLFMCCHPALTPSSAIALTLRAVGGLTTAEIGNAFLVPEATMAQRISRAKNTIRDSAVGFILPTPPELSARLDAVLHVLYLIFNEGYTASRGAELQRTDLASEAIRLTRALAMLLPEKSEVDGLLALMLLTDARREARTGESGEIIPLDEQDRTRWNRALIAEGLELVAAAMSRGAVGPYQLQAAIAALHCEAAHAEETDWPQILMLYELLDGIMDNPMVTLNRAIATAMVHGPAAGIALLDTLDTDDRIRNHYRLEAVRAHFCEMANDAIQAVHHYRNAAERTKSIPERNYLLAKAARLGVSAGPASTSPTSERSAQ